LKTYNNERAADEKKLSSIYEQITKY